MKTICLIVLFCLGCEWGSFFTLIGDRIPRGEPFLKGNSHCDKCNHELKFWDKIPILSYIFLQGRCRYCHGIISPISTYMEFFTGVLFAIGYYIFDFTPELFIAYGIVGMLIIIASTDINEYIIPDKILIFFSIYFIICELFNVGFLNTLLKIASGLFLFFLMYAIMYIGNKMFKKESLGGGDIKMMFVIGLVLEPLPGTLSIFVASFLALPIAIIALSKKRENIIPFGPFLLVAFMFMFYMQFDTNTIIDLLKLI